jgi:NAD(P)-dependent dehydrogenase (short-subunit alcohol dehydrogenase family)
VANAGFYFAGPLVANSLAEELDVLTLHGAVPLQLAHRFGRDFAQRGRGAIILVSSSVAASPVPFEANYAAVKAYVLSPGQALNYELKKDGVDVLVVSPRQTQTEGLDNAVGIDFSKLGGPRMAPPRVVGAPTSFPAQSTTSPTSWGNTCCLDGCPCACTPRSSDAPSPAIPGTHHEPGGRPSGLRGPGGARGVRDRRAPRGPG